MSRTSLRLVKCGPAIERGSWDATYILTHQTTGPGGTSLDLDLNTVVSREGVTAHIDLSIPKQPSEEAALDKLAEWLERAAVALRERSKEPTLSLRIE